MNERDRGGGQRKKGRGGREGEEEEGGGGRGREGEGGGGRGREGDRKWGEGQRERKRVMRGKERSGKEEAGISLHGQTFFEMSMANEEVCGLTAWTSEGSNQMLT